MCLQKVEFKCNISELFMFLLFYYSASALRISIYEIDDGKCTKVYDLPVRIDDIA